MLERLRNNLGLKVISIVLAVVAWAYLRLTPNPVIAARFVQQVSVPITTTGLRPEEVARFGDHEAVVAVEVPRGGAAIKPEMVRTVLNLEGRGPGVYNVPVEVIAPKLDVRSLAPASVTLTIERIESRSLPVTLHYFGDLRRNIVVGRATVDPAYATINAPTSDLQHVAAVRVDVQLPGTPSNFDAMVRPIAADARGAELGSVAVSPNLMRVRVRFAASAKH